MALNKETIRNTADYRDEDDIEQMIQSTVPKQKPIKKTGSSLTALNRTAGTGMTAYSGNNGPASGENQGSNSRLGATVGFGGSLSLGKTSGGYGYYSKTQPAPQVQDKWDRSQQYQNEEDDIFCGRFPHKHYCGCETGCEGMEVDQAFQMTAVRYFWP